MTDLPAWSARWRIAAILLAVILANTAYALLIPLVPQLEQRAGLNSADVALMFAGFAGARALTQPLGGLWVDRWRASGVALTSMIVVAICVYLLATARTPSGVLASRVGWGVGEGLLTPALYQGINELCARHAFPASRALAWFGASAVLGLMAGPAFAGVAAGLGLFRLCLVSASITLVTGFVVYAALREHAASDVPAADGEAVGRPLPRSVWLGTIMVFGVLDLLTNIVYSGLEPTLPLYLVASGPQQRTAQVSMVFVAGMATFAIVSWLLGRLRRGLGLVRLIVVGCLIGSAGVAGLSLGTTVSTVAPAMVIIMIGQPMLYLAARWGTSELRESGRPTGLAFGIFGTISDIGYALGPVVGVFLVGLAGSLGFALLGMIGVCGLLCVGPLIRRRRRPAATCPAPQSRWVRTAVVFSDTRPLRLRLGGSLGEVSVAYETYGPPHADSDNVIFVCHALTGDSHVARHDEDDLPGWWESMVGPGRPIDTDRYAVVCANVLGGCAGTTGPWSPSREGRRFGSDFPQITVPDMVTVHRALLEHLDVKRPLLAVIGGSLGAMQALEWLLRYPGDAGGFLVIAGTAVQSTENLAWHSIGRAAIRADPRFADGHYPPDDRPQAGQGLARMIAHLTYLSETALQDKFGRNRSGGSFAVENYLDHQAHKLNARFDPNTYLYLTAAMDHFDAFADPPAPLNGDAPAVHLFSFAADRLFGSHHSENIRRELARNGVAATHHRDTTSTIGHDAFLLETRPFLDEVTDALDALARRRAVHLEGSDIRGTTS